MDLIGTELSGAQFNKRFDTAKFYIFLDNDMKYFDVQYKLGLNIATTPSVLTRLWTDNRFNFFDESYSSRYYSNFRNSSLGISFYDIGNSKHKKKNINLADVTIPDDATIHVGGDEFKYGYDFCTDKLIIKNVIKFSDIPDEFWLNMVSRNHKMFKYVKNKSEDICILAVKQNGYALKYVPYNLITNEMCMSAVQQNGTALEYVPNNFITNEICIAAVQKDAWALKYVKEQTPEICLLAIKENGGVLQHVKDQTEELCALAIKENYYAFKYVREQTEELCKLAVQEDGFMLEYVKTQTPEICELAVQKNWQALQCVKNQTFAICFSAVMQSFDALEHVRILRWLTFAFVIMFLIFGCSL